ncbi:uncharacterized protein LOC128678591 [Plodia interpunctella]|uniref:uncharacterized protein LOC128678591 n=1 Tax=Plodia interpunctella TaxID=58824 RepID=UPI0023676064|nr:uncharacterized protein LOC128678591 [Plodia interpunctella]
MPRRLCYWTRKLELDLVEFVQQRDFIWRPLGNTNHQIQQKYKAYAEFAAKLGVGYTARSVRDRWVNIRSTFHHNLRRVEKSKKTARSPAEVYVPSWPLWQPLQFLREAPRKEEVGNYENYGHPEHYESRVQVKEELAPDSGVLCLRQRGERTNRPRHKDHNNKVNKCKRVLDDLVKAMEPLVKLPRSPQESQHYWFFGKHVTERLNSMSERDAECASRDILMYLDSLSQVPE